MHKYHYVYKITNNINSRFYIGIHSSNQPNDDYYGSGAAIISAIKKYGKDNFTKEILSYHDSRDEALLEEKDIVNIDLIKDELCYNLKTGGASGFNYNDDWIKQVSERAKITHVKSINSEQSKLKRAQANRRRAASGEYSTIERRSKISKTKLAQSKEISARVILDWQDPEKKKIRCENMKGKKKEKECKYCGRKMKANLSRHIKAQHFELS